MHQEHYISGATLLATALWGITGGMILAAWGMAALGGSGTIAEGLALTASALAPVAAVAHVRIYIQKVCRLIRTTAGLTAPPREEGTLPKLVR